ncbi:MAG: N-acetylglucosamine-6-phosphate deacetylase [Planctomycetota bacterium]
MNEGSINAWHYGTRQPMRVAWREGRITQFESCSAAPENLWVAPPLTDLQINGYAGVYFANPSVTLEDMRTVVRSLYAAGCARLFVTLTTDPWPKIMARLKAFREMRTQCPELRSAIAGWHIEGPFLSAEPGFCGAHDPSVMCDPKPEHVRELREATAGDPVLLTLAPERAGALEVVALASGWGIKVSLGHTNASAETIRRAVQAGAVAFTHLANGCPQQLDRHDNIVWRALDTPGLCVGLIPDRIHVSPMAFRIMHRVLDPGHIWYTTDAVSPAGMPPGRYKIGRLEVDVGPDQVVRHPGQTNFAGSALRPIHGILRAAAMLGCPWQSAWRHFSAVPRQLMDLDGDLGAGKEATFCVLETDGANGAIRSGKLYVNGAPHEMTGLVQ